MASNAPAFDHHDGHESDTRSDGGPLPAEDRRVTLHESVTEFMSM